jgi:hypothetical protein
MPPVFVDGIEIVVSTYSPLDQFEIRDLLSLKATILSNTQLSLTNIGMYLSIGTFIILSLKLISTNCNKIVSNY